MINFPTFFMSSPSTSYTSTNSLNNERLDTNLVLVQHPSRPNQSPRSCDKKPHNDFTNNPISHYNNNNGLEDNRIVKFQVPKPCRNHNSLRQHASHRHRKRPRAAFGPLSGKPARRNLGRLHLAHVDWVGTGLRRVPVPDFDFDWNMPNEFEAEHLPGLAKGVRRCKP